ncbi:MAG TPA: hypothetical protein VMI31_05215, partial [Fimbriimonadaceae bacterium]|nr:hypothetical protein [Fimbriimonadaceae bacterium]
AANENRIELILDLFHYGYPEDLDLLGPDLPKRFEAYCRGVAETVAGYADVPVHFTPVNEPSYFAWAAGNAALFAPFLVGRAPDLKIALMRAAIRGIEAIWSVLAEARIVNVDPVCHVVSPFGDHSRDREVRDFNERAVFECWDMLAGRLHPELGGSPRHLDIVGMNYYWTNQWEVGREGDPLSMDDARLSPVSQLIASVWQRYEHPIVVTETSHVENMRGPWLRYMAGEVREALEAGIPVEGICLYPILGMPEWHQPEVWTRMGLWDCVPGRHGDLSRQIHSDTLSDYLEASRIVGEARRNVSVR